MHLKHFTLIACASLTLAGCASYQGGTMDQAQYDGSLGEGTSQPTAAPTFRPGLNREDPRDPQFTTRPQPNSSPSTTVP